MTAITSLAGQLLNWRVHSENHQRGAQQASRAIRSVAALFTACSILAAPDVRANPGIDSNFTYLGILKPFYRGTQLQSIFKGQGLLPIPSYLSSTDTDIHYLRNPKLVTEIPFVSRITFTRFVGGYREQSLRMARLWTDELGLQSGDYVRRNKDNSLQYVGGFVRDRLDPYLSAGYRLKDITISLSNIPWALARNSGAEGPWGQKLPASSDREWTETVAHLLREIKSTYPTHEQPRYKLGVEYDDATSFAATEEEYLRYFSMTSKVVREVSPGSQFSPGEFTRKGVCNNQSHCVYDTQRVVRFAKAKRIAVDYVPRSLNSFQFLPGSTPRATVQRAVRSYARLGRVRKEIHQFGLLGQPFSSDWYLGGDVGARAASWDFQTLVGLKQYLNPDLVNHWDTFATAAGNQVALLNGTGFVRLLLDRYLGAGVTLIPYRAVAPSDSEIVVAQFNGPAGRALVISAFTPGNLAHRIRVTIDSKWIGRPSTNDRIRVLRYGEADNVFMEIRRDLAAAGNLKPEFDKCAMCVAHPLNMSVDQSAARLMLLANNAKYESKLKRALIFQDNRDDSAYKEGGNQIELGLSGNEIVVLEVGRFAADSAKL
jgi:hypothetical protein